MRRKTIVRYSETFKMSVVKEYESGGLTKSEINRKFGIKGGATFNGWLNKYGSPNSQNKIMRVESKGEINRLKELEKENKRLKEIIANQAIRNVTQESFLEVFAEEQGVTVEQLKKKLGAKL